MVRTRQSAIRNYRGNNSSVSGGGGGGGGPGPPKRKRSSAASVSASGGASSSSGDPISVEGDVISGSCYGGGSEASSGDMDPRSSAAGSESSLEPAHNSASAESLDWDSDDDDELAPPPGPPGGPPASGSSGAGNSFRDSSDLVIYGTRESGVQTNSSDSDSKKCPLVQQQQLPDDLKVSLECPVCSRISLPPIMQCRNGHVTCNPCRSKVQSCPMCREIDIDIRNMFAEKAITYLTIQCDFDTYGCREMIQFRDKDAHERRCKYRPYICPYIECDHKLSADAVVDHVATAHREECRRSEGPEITASMILIGRYFGGDGAWSPRVITCFGRTFFDVALTRDRWLHHWVWLLGEEDDSANYIYEITAFKGNTKYVYGGEVSSLRTTDDEIVNDGQCLSISDSIGRRLRDGDKIRYKLKLMKKSDVEIKR